jgi:hypothetical protein
MVHVSYLNCKNILSTLGMNAGFVTAPSSAGTPWVLKMRLCPQEYKLEWFIIIRITILHLQDKFSGMCFLPTYISLILLLLDVCEGRLPLSLNKCIPSLNGTSIESFNAHDVHTEHYLCSAAWYSVILALQRDAPLIKFKPVKWKLNEFLSTVPGTTQPS